jgi:hypothetical protein
MQAIQGYFDQGLIKLDRKAPLDKGRVIVIFPVDEPAKNQEMTTAEAYRILDKYRGSIKGDISIETERDEYLNEKYGVVN